MSGSQTRQTDAAASAAAQASAASSEERRRERRMAVDQAATLAGGSSADARARLVDLSRGGARLRVEGAEASVSAGDRLELHVFHPSSGRESRRRVEVVWVGVEDDEPSVGLRFVADSEPQKLNLDEVKIDPIALRIPAKLATSRRVLPFAVVDGRAHVATADASDSRSLAAVERHLRMPIATEEAEPESLRRAIERVYALASDLGAGAGGGSLDGSVDGSISIDAAPDSIALGEQVMGAALLLGASDVHIDQEEHATNVRLRVDGVLERLRELTPEQGGTLISRFKVMAGLDIAEKRAPQDGRFRHEIGRGQTVDVRVATLPTRHGEWMTLRLLSSEAQRLTLSRLGMSDGHLEMFSDAIASPHGLILLTGPTGSGKSTTLYAGLQHLIASRSLNVLTIEDPVEYEIPGVGQMSVDHAEKVTFAKALRAALRNDPDVIMVGEIRDAETADVSIKAALTGHLVLSTLHTNSAAGVITRLRDMGTAPYLTASVLRLAAAQRLVRRLCPRCRRVGALTEVQAAALGRPEKVGAACFEPAGCRYCADRGFVGRLATFEMLPATAEAASMINDSAPESAWAAYMSRRGLPSLIDDASAKVFDGRTSVDEVLRSVCAAVV